MRGTLQQQMFEAGSNHEAVAALHLPHIGLCYWPKPYSKATSHASIAYRKQLPPQRTVGTIGSVWQESTPSKETTGPAQTRKAKGYESEQLEMPNDARAAFAWARGL